MKIKEKFSFVMESLKLGNSANPFFHSLKDHSRSTKLYSINFSNVKSRFIEEIKNYKNHPELIDINEFSMNYSFGYHFLHKIDNMNSKEAMYLEIKDYLNSLKMCA